MVDDLKQRHATLGIVRCALFEFRVGGVYRIAPWAWGEGVSWALPVGGFALLHGGEDVTRVGEVVLVESVMLEAGADQPCRGIPFDEKTPSCCDDLLVVTVEIMVGRPSPHVLDVGGGGVRQMQQTPGGFAVGGSIVALCFYLASYSPADAEVCVP